MHFGLLFLNVISCFNHTLIVLYKRKKVVFDCGFHCCQDNSINVLGYRKPILYPNFYRRIKSDLQTQRYEQVFLHGAKTADDIREN